MLRKRITDEERHLLEKYIKQGFSQYRIAKILGRHKSSIANELKRGGGRNYTAERAIKASAENREKQKAILIKFLSTKQTLIKRVENLEMQLQILLDFIKGMKNDSKN